MRNIFALSLATSLLGACATNDMTRSADFFHPQVVTDALNSQAYAADRRACETTAKATASNFASTSHILFRTCLYEKGYRFLN